MDIKVSICIPAYKQVDLLRKTLQSVIEQSFKNFEIILSDDTPDDSVKLLVSEFDFEGRLNYFKNNPSLGTPGNWNHSIRKAKGEYIKILHHDDFFTSSESLGKFVKLLDDAPESDFGFSATTVWRLSTNEKWKYYITDKQAERLRNEPEFLFFGNWIGAPSAVIYRRSVMEEYDPELKWLVDTDLYIRILRKNPLFAKTNEELVCTADGAIGQVTQEV
ncbi:MAG: glycosyltransferase, partial [Bacteroidota bacterium]|nr:glycosyltransferase [Bacteroidota bacterium]